MKKLIGILNSTLMRFYYETSFPTLHVQRNELASLPIKTSILNKDCCSEIPDLVDRIIKARKQNRDADTRALETSVDLAVFALYGLDDEERKVVEAKVTVSADTAAGA